jgi:Fe2+ or Zn2+ uptake regulation protein
MTKNRAIVKEILCGEARHLSAIEIWETARARGKSLSLATVYNSLKYLVSSHEVAEIHFADRNSRYDARLDAHAHVLCVACGELTDIDLHGTARAVQREAKKILDFEWHGTDITLRGVCPECRKATTRKER